MNIISEMDYQLCEKAFEVARKSKQKGNLPFGCLIANHEGFVLSEAENTVISEGDCIAHCEINLIHKLARRYDKEYLANCTLYASTEPCPMCTAAIVWSGIGRLVFGLSKRAYHKIAGTTDPDNIFDIDPELLLVMANKNLEVAGPILEQKAENFIKVFFQKPGLKLWYE